MFQFKFSKHTFNNGLRFIEAPLKKTGAVAVLVLVKAGSRFERIENQGISHFMEHMFFKGAKKYKNTKEVASAIDQVGGMFNASTEKEEVTFFIKLPGKKTEIALDILSDMLLYPQFRESDINQEKNVVIEEINMYEDSPIFQTSELLESILYKDSSLARRIIGEKETIKAMNQEKLLKYRKNFYLPRNIIIAAAGDTSFISKEKIFKFFRFSPGKGFYFPKKPREVQKKPETSVKFKETEQTHLSLGIRFSEATYNHQDFFVARILSVVLGEGMSSRVFLSLREKKGLAYRINSFMQSFTDTGYIEVSAGVDNTKVSTAIDAIILELKKLREKKVSQKELNKAKEYLKGKLILSLEDSLDAAFYTGRQELLQGKILGVGEIFKKIDNVKTEDLLRLADKNFRPDKLNLALIGPFREEKLFEKNLCMD